MSDNYRKLHPISILTDLEEEQNPTDEFENLSKKIGGIIARSRPKYTIGIYGEWGSGKTTLMKTIQKQFSEKKDVQIQEWIPTVWFNAWGYEREKEQATISLILTILAKLTEVISRSKDDDDKKWFEKTKPFLKKFIKGWSFGLSIPVGFGDLDLSYEDKDNDVYFSKIKKPSIQEGLDFINKFCNNIKSELSNGLKLVVFVDDLDRCSSKKTLEVLESIKILLDIEGIVYVVGLNDITVNRSLEEEYQNNINGNDYMQKIIQIPTRVPMWEDEHLAQLLKNNVKDVLDKRHFDALYGKEKLLYTAGKRNPR